MEINKTKFIKEIFERRCKKNYTQCARELNITPQHVHKFINGKGKAGAKMLGGLMAYCSKNNLEFNRYVFLSKN